MEAHESAAKAGKELMALLDYWPISAWLQVTNATTRPLVYVHLCHVWGYDGDDIGKKTVSAIIYKYLKQQMFLKAHVPTAFLSVKFMMTSSMLHKYIVGKKYKGGAPPGSRYRSKSEEWTKKQQDSEVNKGAGSSGVSTEDLPRGKGGGKKSGKKRDASEIRGDASKPKKKQDTQDDDDEEDDQDGGRPLRPPVTRRGIIIPK